MTNLPSFGDVVIIVVNILIGRYTIQYYLIVGKLYYLSMKINL